MLKNSAKECRSLIKEFLISEESNAWRIRPSLDQALASNIEGGDWSGFETTAEDFARRLRLNKPNNVGVVSLQLTGGDEKTVEVDISKTFYEIDRQAKDKKDVIKIITTSDEKIPIVKFKKAGQFNKSKSPANIIKDGNLNPFLAEWATAYAICSKDTDSNKLSNYFELIHTKDERLKPYLDPTTGIFKLGDGDGRTKLFNIFSDMVKNSYDPFEDAGIATGLGENKTKPHTENTTAAIDIDYEHDGTNYTLHIKFDEKKRIGGIRKEEAPAGADKLDDEVLTDLDKAIESLKPKIPAKTLAQDGTSREEYFKSVTPQLNHIAARIKNIIFHGGSSQTQNRNTFNAIINYSRKLEPSVTVLAKPTERFRQILNSIDFVVEPDINGKTVYMFKVKAHVEKETIEDVLKIEIRNDRVPQLHMSSNWKKFYSIIKDKIKDNDESTVVETIELMKEFLAN